ncbi:unnamed protein product [Sphenostylis stenocarpa]|uniref:CASP-like protein n=1 Tax=Sphenostylis stenocarpa TaxID=92480 RepID=A0AA86STC4_9FABA|nr:unnamed protein product [Sphenostylis stenocarpa]
MVTKRVANSMLVLRMVALATSSATLALLVTNSYTFENGAVVKYQDFDTYSFVVAVAAITCAYCIVQLPFSIYYAIRQKSLVLGTGIGAGFAMSVELKKFIDKRVHDVDGYKSVYSKVFIRGFVASAFLLVSFLSMAIVSFISSNNRNTKQPTFY